MAISLKEIITAPWNTRGEITPESVKELADSIKEQGLINPITIWRGDDDAWYCIAGNRRLAAMKMLNIEGGEFYTEFNGNEHAAKMVTLTENLQREDVGVIEEADGVTALLNEGKTSDWIAARLGRSRNWVSRRRKLSALTDSWREIANEIDADALEKIAEYPADAQDRIAKKAGNQCRSWRDLRYYVESEMHDLDACSFCTNDCEHCEKRTGAQADLFGTLEDDAKLGSCLDSKCFDAKAKTHRDALIAKATKNADEVIIRKYEWELPRGENASDKRTKANPCAYVCVGYNDEVKVVWGESEKARKEREKKQEAEREATREAERAERERADAITDKLDEFKDGDGNEDSITQMMLQIVKGEASESACDWAVATLIEAFKTWHSSEEWASILRAFPNVAKLADVTDDDSAYLCERYSDDDENE